MTSAPKFYRSILSVILMLLCLSPLEEGLKAVDLNANPSALADTTPPVAVCKDTNLFLNSFGNASIAANLLDGGSTDNVGIATFNASQSNFNCSHKGVRTVTLTVFDFTGNSSTCTSNVTISDNAVPVMNCQDVTINLDASGNVDLTPSLINDGSSDNCGIDSIFTDPTSLNCSNTGVNSVTLAALDESGNFGFCLSNVTVQDVSLPMVVCNDYTVYLDTAGNASVSVVDIDAGSTDNCGINGRALNDSIFDCGDLGSVSIVMAANDDAANTASCTANISVRDTTDPVALCNDVTLQLNSAGSVGLSVPATDAGSSDNCSLASRVISKASFTCFDLGSNTVTLTVTDPAGNASSCISNVMVVDTIGLTTLPVDLGIDINLCPGTSQILNAGAGFAGYSWSTGASTVAIPVFGAGVYSVTVTSISGCTGTDMVEVFDIIAPDTIIELANQDALCLGDTAILEVNDPYVSYLWSTGQTTTQIEVYTPGDVNISVTDGFGCTFTDVYEVEFLPIEGPTPVVTPGGKVRVCPGSDAILDAGDGYYGYLWSTGDTSQTINAPVPGTYSVTVENGFGCKGTSDLVTVTPYETPSATITALGATLIASDGEAWQWFQGGAVMPGATNQTLNITVAGFYGVEITFGNGCVVFTDTLIFEVSRIEDLSNNIAIYPNPAKEQVKISGISPDLFGGALSLVDLTGKEILRKYLDSGSVELSLDLQGISPGIYFLNLNSDKGRATKKLAIIGY